LDLMDKLAIKPSSQLFSSLLAACGKRWDINSGRKVHARILGTAGRDKNSADTGHYSTLNAALITMYSDCGYLSDAEAVFADVCQPKHMSSSSELLPTYARPASVTISNPRMFSSTASKDCSVTWTAMISAYAAHGNGAKALALFNDMLHCKDNLKGRLEINPMTISSVLNGCSHSNLASEGLAIFNLLLDGRFAPVVADVGHLTCIVDALGRAGRLNEAEQIIDRTETSIGLKPNQITWMTLLGACRKHGDVSRAERILQQLKNGSPSPEHEAAAHVLMANIYAQNDRLEDRNRMRQEMGQRSLKKVPGKSWITDDDGIQHEFFVEDKRHPRSSEIYAVLDDLHKRMKEIGFKPNYSVVTHPSILSDKDEAKDCHLAHHSEKLAIGFGLLTTPKGSTLRVFKNLRVCSNCHETTKYIAKLTQREIIVPDANRFHHFLPNGNCSCSDFW